MLKVSKFAIIAAVTLIGCAKPPPPAPIPVGPQVAPKTTPKADKPTALYTVTLPNGWKLINSTSLKSGEDPQLVAIYENELGRTETNEKISAQAGLVAGHLSASESESYYDDIRNTAHSRSNAKVVKERMVKLGDLPAYEWLELRTTPSGTSGFVGVAVTNGKVGYVFACGSPVEYAEDAIPACVELVESLRITK